jgi:CspA family cold shock protein
MEQSPEIPVNTETDVTPDYTQSSTNLSTVEVDILGCVKWFNSKLGYGFITNLLTNEDIFVHYTSVKSESDTFRYLVQGEYVQFTVAKTNVGPHDKHAVYVTGVYRGRLLCDVHQANYAGSSSLNNKREYSTNNSRPSDGDRDEPAVQNNRNYSTSQNTRYPPSKKRYNSQDTPHEGSFRTPRSALGK